MLVLMTLSVIRGDLLIEESAKKSDQGEAATFIPFITHLIRVKLTHDEKLNISQNLYNAYKKKDERQKCYNQRRKRDSEDEQIDEERSTCAPTTF